MMRLYSLLLLLVWLFHCPPAVAGPAVSAQVPISPKIQRLIKDGGFIVQKEGHIHIAYNTESAFIPASILKIATSLAALKILGPSYRFETAFYSNDAGDLFIKGYGDPFLVSEEVALILERLRATGVSRINNIILDDTAYQLDSPADGSGESLNPYDVISGGLCVNFNTVNVTVTPDGAIHSAEPQTPTLPIMKKLSAGMKPGEQRFNISNNRGNVLQYAGELFRALQRQNKIPGEGRIGPGKVPAGLTAVYIHRSSKNLESLIKGLMLYSNNFIANQLFLACGAKQLGYPATWEKSRTVLKDYLQTELGLGREMISMVEGAGLSRGNRATPQAMTILLDAFKPYAHLLPLERDKYIKSGTLTGVYSYAGYFRNGAALDSFVLMLNQKQNTRDRLLAELEETYRRK